MSNAAAVLYEYQLLAAGEPVNPGYRISPELLEDTLLRLGIERNAEDGKYYFRKHDGKLEKIDSPSLALKHLARNDPEWLEFMRSRFEEEYA